MKLVTFWHHQTPKVGILIEAGVVDAHVAMQVQHQSFPENANGFFADGLCWSSKLQVLDLQNVPTESIHQETDINYAPLTPSPSKIICVGLNYKRHAEESGMPLPTLPILFSKFNNSLAAHQEAIPISSDWKAVDYEAELVVVMGHRAYRVSEEKALDYVLGYTIGNDLSERNLQLKTQGNQWLLGKTLPKFLPLGPYLTTTDEIPDPQALSIKGWFNSELRQDSHTSDMVFSVAECIAYISHHIPLEAGDIISTGTPEGVILGEANPQYMKANDTYEIEISHIGRLSNQLIGQEKA